MQHLKCQEPWRRSWETGETRGEDRQDLGGARSRCNSGPGMCLCQRQRASAALSVQRQWSVQLQSVAPRLRSIPCRPEPYQPGQARQRHTTRARNFCFSSKMNPFNYCCSNLYGAFALIFKYRFLFAFLCDRTLRVNDVVITHAGVKKHNCETLQFA